MAVSNEQRREGKTQRGKGDKWLVQSVEMQDAACIQHPDCQDHQPYHEDLGRYLQRPGTAFGTCDCKKRLGIHCIPQVCLNQHSSFTFLLLRSSTPSVLPLARLFPFALSTVCHTILLSSFAQTCSWCRQPVHAPCGPGITAVTDHSSVVIFPSDLHC